MTQHALPLLTVTGLAALLAKPTSWIHDNLRLLPPPIRLGRQLRWRPEVIQAWLDSLAESA